MASSRRVSDQYDARAFVSANATANQFLGGRQKAWMTGEQPQSMHNPNTTNAAAQRRPNPVTRVSACETTRLQTDTIQDSVSRPPLSILTSPLLANVLALEKDTHSRPPSTNVLPSPAPSDDTSGDAIARINTPNNDNITEGSVIVLDDSQDPQGVASPTETQTNPEGVMNIVRKRAAVLQNIGASKRRQPDQRHVALNWSSHRQLTAQIPPHTRHHRASASNSASPLQTQSPVPARPLSRVSTSNQPSPMATSVPTPTPSDYFTYSDCVKAMNDLRSRFRIEDDERGSQRFTVLRDAVGKGDWAYLTMHQYFCIASCGPEQLPRDWRDWPALHTTLDIMGQVLAPNKALNPHLVRWFSKFPMQLGQIAVTWPERYKKEQDTFRNFVERCSASYSALKEHCQVRKYPPLAGELFDQLGIVSSTFGHTVFLATLRSLWIRGPGVGTTSAEAEASKLFYQCHVESFEKLRQTQFNPTEEHRRYAPVFQQLLARHEEEVQEIQRRFAAISRSHNAPQPVQVQIPNTVSLPSFPGSPTTAVLPPFPTPGAPHLTLATTMASSSSSALHSSTYPLLAQNSNAAYHQNRLPVTAQQIQPHGRGRIINHQPQGAGFLQTGQDNSHPTVNHQQVLLQTQQRQLGYMVFPPSGIVRPQPVQPDAAQSALHQAHLQSPTLKAPVTPAQLYQCIKGYQISPWRLDTAKQPFQIFTFSMSEGDMSNLPEDMPGSYGEAPTRIVTERTQSYQLRCAKWESSQMPAEHAWAVADTSWVPFTYFKLNGSSLQPRKKLHNGKDLPVDITRLLRKGDNTLEIASVRYANDPTHHQYLLAIEVIGTVTHETIKQSAMTDGRRSAPEVLDSIRKSLSGVGEDDDISIVSSNISITLFDPFSASRIFDVPVRGRNCLHYDCFDLETFLQTRRRKGDISVLDQWKCPICRADARPHNLIVDGFMEKVRAQLTQQGRLDTRAIVVEQDGTWRPKPEQRDPNGVQDRDSPEEELLAVADPESTVPAPRPELTVIDLSD